MGRFVLDCDALSGKVDEFNLMAGGMQNLGNTVSSFPVNSSEFNFAKAINCIASNLEACAKKINNTGVLIGNVIEAHTNLQNSMVYDKTKYKTESDNNSNKSSSETYTIQSGDTLSNIAARHNTTVEAIAKENNISNPNLIYANDQIKIPSGSKNSSSSNSVSRGSSYVVSSGILSASTTSGISPSSSSSSGVVSSSRINVDGVDGTVINIPAGLGSVHTYMGWQMITAPSSNQYKLREEAGMNFDKEGFGIIGDRYVIACTTTFGNVGDCVDFVQEDGSVLKCVIGDIKSQEYVPWDHNPANQWGHNNGQCIVEFVVDKTSWYNCGHPNPGNRGCHPEWHQNITQAINYGNYKNYLSKQV